MKKFFFSICISYFFILNSSFAQPSGRFKNEWINYNQPYLKIVVLTKGIYRINKADIEAKGFGVGANPEKLQLFHRGEEIAINVDGQTNSAYNYIEFFAINNDGFQDDEVYYPKQRFNENYSIYSDSTSYFLTIGTANGKRIPNTTAVNTGITADNHILFKSIINYSNEWNQDIATSKLPPATQSYYETDEGLCSIWYFLKNGALAAKPFNTPFPLPNYLASAGIPVNYESKIVSRKAQNKTVEYNLGDGVIGNFNLTNFGSYKLNRTINNITGSQIPSYYQITTNPAIDDYFSLVYQIAKYPRSLIYSDNLEFESIINANGSSRIRLSSANSGIIGYDITDFKNQKKLSTSFNSSDNTIDISIDGTTTSKKIWLSHIVKTPAMMRMANFSQTVQANYDYLIITDPRLKSGAEAYKAYRESNDLNGGRKFKVLIKYAQELYDEFGYGERNPIAIRRFADYMTSTPAVMKYLFLIGKGYTYTTFLRTRSTVDLAPSFGSPGSDNLLTGGLLGLPLTIPAIPTGRLVVGIDDTGAGGGACTTCGSFMGIGPANQEILNYIEKVRQHEHRTTSTWQKNVLNVAGPKTGGSDGSGGEHHDLFTTLEEIRTIAINSPFANASNYVSYNKQVSLFNTTTSTYPEVAVPADFYTKINTGAGIVTYFGHGTGLSTSHNIGFVSKIAVTGAPAGGPLNYTNNGKYPLLLAMGCGISNSFQRDPSLTADWIKTPGKGALIAIGQSTISYESYDTKFLHTLFNTWFTTTPTTTSKSAQSKVKATNAMLNDGIGDILKQSLINQINDPTSSEGDPSQPNYDIIFGASFQQTILEGDPAIQLLKDPTILPLSLTLLEVKALNDDKLVKVIWKTENEKSFDKFEIEKSVDSKKFQIIGSINGKGNSDGINNYTFEDINPNIGINYYRLKMIDLDGTSQYSNIVSANYIDTENNLMILENPTKNNQFLFKLINYYENSGQLFDLKGSKIQTNVVKVNENTFKVNSKNNLNKGLYIFKAQNKFGNLFSSKIVIE